MQVSKGVLKALAEFSHRDSTRFAMHSVNVDGPHLVSTNGHVLASYDLGETAEHGGILPLPGVLGVVKALGARESAELNGSLAAPNGAHAEFAVDAGHYPDWKRCVPDDAETEQRVTFSATYLQSICRAVKALGGSSDAVTFHLRASEGGVQKQGVKFTAVSDSGFSGVIMPVVVRE